MWLCSTHPRHLTSSVWGTHVCFILLVNLGYLLFFYDELRLLPWWWPPAILIIEMLLKLLTYSIENVTWVKIILIDTIRCVIIRVVVILFSYKVCVALRPVHSFVQLVCARDLQLLSWSADIMDRKVLQTFKLNFFHHCFTRLFWFVELDWHFVDDWYALELGFVLLAIFAFAIDEIGKKLIQLLLQHLLILLFKIHF